MAPTLANGDHDLEINQAQLLEHFRGSADEAEIGRAAMHPLLMDLDANKPDFDLDAEFDQALCRVREYAIAADKRRLQMQRALDMGLG